MERMSAISTEASVSAPAISCIIGPVEEVGRVGADWRWGSGRLNFWGGLPRAPGPLMKGSNQRHEQTRHANRAKALRSFSEPNVVSGLLKAR